MKKRSVKEFLRSAEVGYLTKDEYRIFQKKLKSDQELRDRLTRVLLQDDFSDLGNENTGLKSEGNSVTDSEA